MGGWWQEAEHQPASTPTAAGQLGTDHIRELAHLHDHNFIQKLKAHREMRRRLVAVTHRIIREAEHTSLLLPISKAARAAVNDNPHPGHHLSCGRAEEWLLP